MKEIIEADTDPKKKVLRLRPTFAPAPTQQIMLSNLGQGGRPWRLLIVHVTSFDHFSTSDRSKL